MNEEDRLRGEDDSRPLNERQRRLIIATTLRPDGNTGIHTHVEQFRRYLASTGADSVFVTPFSWNRALTYPVFGLRRLALDRFSEPAGIVWYRHWHEVFLRMALRRMLRDAGDCVVYAQDPLAASAALRARKNPHQRVILAAHFRISQADEYAAGDGGIEHGGPVFRAIRRFEGQVIPKADGIVFVSRWARNALFDWLPEASAVPSVVIGNFVAPLPDGPVREPLGDLVTTGRLEPAKNQRFLLEVLTEAKRVGQVLSLDVFGDGPSRAELLRLTRVLGLEAQVRFHGFRTDVRELLPGYRAYVHASRSESLPLAIIEAMAAGLPVVTGDTGGISEICDDGVEGRFWPLDDAVEAAATLIRLLDCEPARAKAAAAAKQRFDRDFDAEVVAPRLRSFLLGTTTTDA